MLIYGQMWLKVVVFTLARRTQILCGNTCQCLLCCSAVVDLLFCIYMLHLMNKKESETTTYRRINNVLHFYFPYVTIAAI